MQLDLPIRLGKKNWLIVFTLALIILLSYYIWPLLDGLVLGLVFAYVGRPVRDLFGKNRRIGSLAAIICIVVPLSAIFATGVVETSNQIRWLESHEREIVTIIYEFVSRVHIPQAIFDEISRGMANLMGMGLNLLASLPVFSLGSTITLGIVNFLIAFCVCYFLLLDGDRLAQAVRELFHLENGSFELRCLARIDSILCGVYMGSIYTAIAGGITSVAIFYIFAVPRPFAMASIVFLAGMVPFLTWLVFIPTAVGRYIEIGPMDAWSLLPGRLDSGSYRGAGHPALHRLYQVLAASAAGAACLPGRRPCRRNRRLLFGSGNGWCGDRCLSGDDGRTGGKEHQGSSNSPRFGEHRFKIDLSTIEIGFSSM